MTVTITGTITTARTAADIIKAGAASIVGLPTSALPAIGRGSGQLYTVRTDDGAEHLVFALRREPLAEAGQRITVEGRDRDDHISYTARPGQIFTVEG